MLEFDNWSVKNLHGVLYFFVTAECAEEQTNEKRKVQTDAKREEAVELVRLD